LKVELIEHTPYPERTVAIAIGTCHAPHIPGKDELGPKRRERLIKLVKTSGHHSVMEHVCFTFAVSGVSRALTHQLVRHRIASYSQQSQRYVRMEGFGFTVPPTIAKDATAEKVYGIIMDNLAKGYKHLVEMGIPKEDARYVLPNAAHTNIVVTMNARELLHFISLRSCLRSQWEIRELADKMLAQCRSVAPVLFEDAGPPCRRGPCPEGDESCRNFNRTRKAVDSAPPARKMPAPVEATGKEPARKATKKKSAKKTAKKTLARKKAGKPATRKKGTKKPAGKKGSRKS